LFFSTLLFALDVVLDADSIDKDNVGLYDLATRLQADNVGLLQQV
jgi:hypothetical protein